MKDFASKRFDQVHVNKRTQQDQINTNANAARAAQKDKADDLPAPRDYAKLIPTLTAEQLEQDIKTLATVDEPRRTLGTTITLNRYEMARLALARLKTGKSTRRLLNDLVSQILDSE